jgi:hypothetical protein
MPRSLSSHQAAMAEPSRRLLAQQDRGGLPLSSSRTTWAVDLFAFFVERAVVAPDIPTSIPIVISTLELLCGTSAMRSPQVFSSA